MLAVICDLQLMNYFTVDLSASYRIKRSSVWDLVASGGVVDNCNHLNVP